jgi:ribosomal-protein-alanine N-acetyltransferase
VIDDYPIRASLRWALARADNDKLIGSCGYTRWNDEEGVAELAYDLSPTYWGSGIMSVAVGAALNWAFGIGSLRRVEAFVMTTNEASIAVLERTRFRREGLFSNHRLVRGIPTDFYLYVYAALAR